MPYPWRIGRRQVGTVLFFDSSCLCFFLFVFCSRFRPFFFFGALFPSCWCSCPLPFFLSLVPCLLFLALPVARFLISSPHDLELYGATPCYPSLSSWHGGRRTHPSLPDERTVHPNGVRRPDRPNGAERAPDRRRGMKRTPGIRNGRQRFRVNRRDRSSSHIPRSIRRGSDARPPNLLDSPPCSPMLSTPPEWHRDSSASGNIQQKQLQVDGSIREHSEPCLLPTTRESSGALSFIPSGGGLCRSRRQVHYSFDLTPETTGAQGLSFMPTHAPCPFVRRA